MNCGVSLVSITFFPHPPLRFAFFLISSPSRLKKPLFCLFLLDFWLLTGRVRESEHPFDLAPFLTPVSKISSSLCELLPSFLLAFQRFQEAPPPFDGWKFTSPVRMGPLVSNLLLHPIYGSSLFFFVVRRFPRSCLFFLL